MDPARLCLAVDIGGTLTRAAVVQGSHVLERREMATRAQTGPEDLLARLVTLIGELRSPGAHWPVGVACTGRVHAGQVSAVNRVTMPGWVNIPVQRRLQEELGGSVALLNDAKAAALAEWPAGAGGNFMFVTVSTGIGSGLILNGELHAPEGGWDVGLGFTDSGLEDGPLEYLVSGRAFGRLTGTQRFGSVQILFNRAEAGDPAAQALLQGPLRQLARRIADAHCLLGLETVCLGGSVGLRAHTRRVVAAYLQQPGAPAVHAARHGADAGLIGAALFASRQLNVP